MKKFRMTPIHYCMVGLLAFIILAISSRLLGGTIVNLFVILLILSGVIYLFLHQLKQVELDELEQIQYVNHQAENGLASLLDKMPVGVIKVNGETNEVEWFNPYAELIFSIKVSFDCNPTIISITFPSLNKINVGILCTPN